MSGIRETRKRGIRWSNKNQIREFPYGSMVGKNTRNSSRPSQPGPLIELPERTVNYVRNAGLTMRPVGVKQTTPIVPDLPRNNSRRNTNNAWKTAKRVMKLNKEYHRPLSKTNYNSLITGIYNQREAKKYQNEFVNPSLPKLVPSTNEPWYKGIQAITGPILGTTPWQQGLTPPRVVTSDGGRRSTRRNKRSYYKK